MKSGSKEGAKLADFLKKSENVAFKAFAKGFLQRLIDANKDDITEKLGKHVEAFVEQFYRRLDALAIILELDDECLAACVIGVNVYLSSNKERQGERIKDKESEIKTNKNINKDKKNTLLDTAVNLWRHFRLINKLAANGATLESPPIRASRIDLFIKIMSYYCHNVKANKKITDSFIEKALKNYHETRDREIERSSDHVETWASTYFKDNQIDEKVKNDFVRRFQCLLKLESTFSSQRDFIRKLLEKDPEIVNNIVGSEPIHAEIKILLKILNEKASFKELPYIGISKLCCMHCNLALDSHKDKLLMAQDDTGHEVKSSSIKRGHHGKGFPWRCPISDTPFMKIFLGDLLYGEFKKLYKQDKQGAKDIIEKIALLSKEDVFELFEISDITFNSPDQSAEADPSIADSFTPFPVSSTRTVLLSIASNKTYSSISELQESEGLMGQRLKSDILPISVPINKSEDKESESQSTTSKIDDNNLSSAMKFFMHKHRLDSTTANYQEDAKVDDIRVKRLFDYIQNGECEKAKELINEDKKILKERDANGCSALHIAVFFRKNAFAAQLVDNYSMDKKEQNKEGETALLAAAYVNNVGYVQMLFEEPNADISALMQEKDRFGWNVFLRASAYGAIEVLEYVVGKVPNVFTLVDSQGRDALSIACYMGVTRMVTHLLDNYAMHFNEKSIRAALTIVDADSKKHIVPILEKHLQSSVHGNRQAANNSVMGEGLATDLGSLSLIRASP